MGQKEMPNYAVVGVILIVVVLLVVYGYHYFNTPVRQIPLPGNIAAMMKQSEQQAPPKTEPPHPFSAPKKS